MKTVNKVYINLGLMILSYAYCIEQMLIPSLIISILNLILSIVFLKKNFLSIEGVLIYGLLISTTIFYNVESSYSGILITVAFNSYISYKLSMIFKNTLLYENILLGWVLIYLIIIFLTLTFPGYRAAYDKLHLFIAVSTLFLPLIFNIYFYRVKISFYKGGRYDTFFNKHVH